MKGLSVARMAAHISYLSKEALQSKFGRNLKIKIAWIILLMLIFKLKVT